MSRSYDWNDYKIHLWALDTSMYKITIKCNTLTSLHVTVSQYDWCYVWWQWWDMSRSYDLNDYKKHLWALDTSMYKITIMCNTLTSLHVTVSQYDWCYVWWQWWDMSRSYDWNDYKKHLWALDTSMNKITVKCNTLTSLHVTVSQYDWCYVWWQWWDMSRSYDLNDYKKHLWALDTSMYKITLKCNTLTSLHVTVSQYDWCYV